jgi:mRNA-degrading endonuclease RelE of RelBE toxin-antitoxin system
MNFKIVYTDDFERKVKRLAKKYRSLKVDLENLIASLEKAPVQGTPIGKNCYKIRVLISSKGKGKSAGARIITYVYVVKKIVYLLSIYDKSEQETISLQDLTSLLETIEK